MEAPKRPCNTQAAGNAAMLVVIDSAGSYWDYFIVKETMLHAFDHFAMPYRVLDLAKQRPDAETLNHCACIVLAQHRICSAFTDKEAELIAEAVRSGVGLVNFDSELRLSKKSFLEIFGFERINPAPCGTNVMRIRDTGHYITGLQEPGSYYQFDKMVTATLPEVWGQDVTVLAEILLGKDQLVYTRHLTPNSAFEPRNYGIVFAARPDNGRAVQFAINPRLWKQGVFGHAAGLDDLFWKSIVWAARKPFAVNMVPPFVTMSWDDCSGRDDFAYADIANRYGYIPMPSLFIKEIPERLFPKIRQGLKSGKLQFNTHGLDYYNLLTFDFGKGELSDEQLKANFQFDDDFWGKVGAEPACCNRLHWGEYGQKGLPFLKQRGRVFFCPMLQVGQHKTDMCLSDGYYPYNLQTCYYDYMPNDRDFFGMAGFWKRGQEDFLTGSTANLRESEHNDIEKAAQTGAKMIRHGLKGGFFSELATHEQKFEALSMPEWDAILKRIDELTGNVEKIYASHDRIARYLRAKTNTVMTGARTEGKNVICDLEGQADTTLILSAFENEDDGVIRRYADVETFRDNITVEG